MPSRFFLSLALSILLAIFFVGQFWDEFFWKGDNEFIEEAPYISVDTEKEKLPATTLPEEEPVDLQEEIIIIPPLWHFELPVPPPSILSTSTQVATTSAVILPTASQPKPFLPPVDEEAIFRAVVKIECPTKDGLGKYVGSGFVLEDRKVVTAAHVVENSGKDECAVIFPFERKPTYFLRGILIDMEAAKKRFNEKGIDLAFIELPDLSQYPEGRAIFAEKYPTVPYPLCDDPQMLGSTIFHYGYPANFQDLNYLERLKGESVEYADIKGIDNGPIFSSTRDESQLHPYMVSRTGVFYGASGGLAFNETRQCILGPHHGFSSGSNDSHSIFLVLGWEEIKSLLEP